MTRLVYDDAGLAADRIGEPYGLDDSAREELGPDVDTAVERVVEAHEAGELGYLDLVDRDGSGIEEWASRKRRGRWTDALVIGIGGSSLGTRAVYESARPDELDGLDLHVAENVDPDEFGPLLDRLDLDKTLVVVVTKSGTTVETMSKFAVVYDRLREELGPGRAASQVVAVTDPQEGALRRLAESEGFETFAIPPDVGGRFSVLSPVGLVPLALSGYPIARLLYGARRAREEALETPFPDNGIRQAAADLFALSERGVREVAMMAYSERLDGLVDWFRQLWAESLGKAENRRGETVHAGTTPVKAKGTVDQHSQVQLYMEGPADRLVLFVGVEEYDESVEVPDSDGLPSELAHLAGHSLGDVMVASREGTQRALAEQGRPTARWSFDAIRPENVGAFLLSWELVTGVMGELLDIDAYDQPGVELGKNIAHGRLGDPDHSDYDEAPAGERSFPILGS